MSLKSRILRLIAILLALVLVIGFFLFSTLFFSPFERDLETDLSGLIPRKVDFYVSKADLASLFDPFPRLAVQDELETMRTWRLAADDPRVVSRLEESGVQQALAQLDEALAQLPPGIEPLSVFGGRDVALAGFFRGADPAAADWALYGRASWMGKLGAGLLRYPGLIGLEAQGIAVEKSDDWVRLSGGQLTRPIFVGRIRDVVIVATQAELVQAAFDLQAAGYQDSLQQSAPYFDHIENASRLSARDEIELTLDARSMLEELRLSGAWPNARSQDLAEALAGQYFQLASVKNLFGVAGWDEGVRLDVHGELSSELVTPLQNRFYRTRGFSRETLLEEAASAAPADACLFVYARLDVGDLLGQLFLSMEAATRELIEDSFRNTGRYSSLDQLVADLKGAVKDRIAIIVRPNDYPEDPQGPPHDDAPVFATALILWTQDAQRIIDLRELIGTNGSRFGLRGRTPGEAGFFSNTVEGGFQVREFWSPFVPGTGVVATVNAGEMTIVANSFQMLGHILKTFTQGGSRYPRLSEDGRFLGMTGSSMPNSNAVVWVDPRSAAGTLREQARYTAGFAVQVDWKAERARIEDKVLRESFPGQRRGELTPEVQEQVDRQVDPELDDIQKRVLAEQVPAIVAERERWIEIAQSVPAALLMLALDPKSFELSLRVPFEPR